LDRPMHHGPPSPPSRRLTVETGSERGRARHWIFRL
jgi:hypothetical protein